jgi:hypothetical protein
VNEDKTSDAATAEGLSSETSTETASSRMEDRVARARAYLEERNMVVPDRDEDIIKWANRACAADKAEPMTLEVFEKMSNAYGVTEYPPDHTVTLLENAHDWVPKDGVTVCEVCTVTFTDWTAHRASPGHVQMVAWRREWQADYEREMGEESEDAFRECGTCHRVRAFSWFTPDDDLGRCIVCVTASSKYCSGPTAEGTPCPERIIANGRCSTHDSQMRRRGYMTVIAKRSA